MRARFTCKINFGPDNPQAQSKPPKPVQNSVQPSQRPSLAPRRTWRKRLLKSWLGLVLICLLSGLLGWGMAVTPGWAQSPPSPVLITPPSASAESGGVDFVPPQLRLSEQTYLQYCASCHVGVPPQALPTQTWQVLLTDPQHYGLQLRPIPSADRSVITNYIGSYAYPFKEEETVPFRIGRSRFFRILHPQVPLPQPVKLEGCISCHPGAKQFDYRRLSGDWP